ncbi:MAG TPA: cytochrome c oxidase subunit II [Acidimicrobiales bacterium]
MPRRSLVVRIAQIVSLVVVTVLFVVLILSAFMNDGMPLTTLVPGGPSAQQIQDLVVPVFAIAGVVFVGVMGILLFISWRFGQDKDDDPEEFPEQVHGRTALEIGWTVLPAIILAGVAVATVVTILQLEKRDDDAIKVQAIGNQWWWEYKYDIDGDGNYDGAEDIHTATELVIPIGREIAVTTTSNDVIHSFWIPGLNGKKDAVPGLFSPLKLEADEEGIYRGQCTEFCGLSHANMRMLVRSLSPDQYDEWVANQQTERGEEPSDPVAQEGLAVWKAFCAQCHVINGINDEELAETPPPLVSGVAPNLTHLMTRGTFAGSIFNLYGDVDSTDRTDGDNGEALGFEPADVAAAGDPGEALTGGPVDVENVNKVALEEWLRNAPEMKPMYAQGGRGMPNLELSEEQIDQLVAFLMTLN